MGGGGGAGSDRAGGGRGGGGESEETLVNPDGDPSALSGLISYPVGDWIAVRGGGEIGGGEGEGEAAVAG